LKKYTLKTHTIDLLADTLTPVGIYLQVRDNYANSILLESTDYHGVENSCSYICCHPISSISAHNDILTIIHPDEEKTKKEKFQLVEELQQFIDQFEIEGDTKEEVGLYGYHCYDAVQHFETISFKKQTESIPVVQYALYSFVVVINHFNSTLKIIHTQSEEDKEGLDDFVTLIKQANHPKYNFRLPGKEETNYTDEEYLSMVSKGIEHCKKGDVFQIVLSRQFQQPFQGDEFNVYRALRAVNPSPYLFYFDYGSFRLMGSSPEAQIVVNKNIATINPIAGTFRRTGNDKDDAELAKKLSDDEKENAEHVMLVDLARNDLSKSASKVKVEVYKEVQYYSHVIHLVSRVTGEISDKEKGIDLMANTFPAGTLSGAPKYKAMELIDKYESTPRGFYGGAIGFIGLDGSINQAIMIRSLMSKNNRITYQAGAGIVAKSNPESELQEVENKLAAIRKALELAIKLEH